MRRSKRGSGRRGGRSKFASNCSDAAFAQIKLWQDLNQDGVSQANELFALADKGIASIGLNGTAANTNLGNGNTVGATAVVTRSDGSTTTDVPVSEVAQALLADVQAFASATTKAEQLAQLDRLIRNWAATNDRVLVAPIDVPS